jgi:hypothetical protein
LALCFSLDGARSVELSIAQGDALDRCGEKHRLLEREHAIERHARGTMRHTQQVVLEMRLSTRRIEPGNALCDYSPHSGLLRRAHEICRALAANAGIAYQGLRHRRRAQIVRQVGQLVDEDLRSDAGESSLNGRYVEDIGEYRLGASCLEICRPLAFARGAEDAVARFH